MNIQCSWMMGSGEGGRREGRRKGGSGLCLGMVKIEAFDDHRFMNQTIRVCHTDHTDSIIACIACSFDLKNNF